MNETEQLQPNTPVSDTEQSPITPISATEQPPITDTPQDVSAPACTENATTRAEEKRLAYKYLLFAGITLALIYVPHIFRLLIPLFDKIYYGNLSEMFMYICHVVFWVPLLPVLYKQIKKHTGYKVFRKSGQELSLKRSLWIYLCAVLPIFLVSAVLGFELKIVYELGKRVTAMQITTNVVMYADGFVKLILCVVIIELVQEAAELLYKGKYARKIPWGGIVLCVLYGSLELIVAYALHLHHGLAWLYVAFDLLYGVIYLLSKKNFFITYFVGLIIYLL